MMMNAHSFMSYLFYAGGGGGSILRIEHSGTKKPTGVKFLFKSLKGGHHEKAEHSHKHSRMMEQMQIETVPSTT